MKHRGTGVVLVAAFGVAACAAEHRLEGTDQSNVRVGDSGTSSNGSQSTPPVTVDFPAGFGDPTAAHSFTAGTWQG